MSDTEDFTESPKIEAEPTEEINDTNLPLITSLEDYKNMISKLTNFNPEAINQLVNTMGVENETQFNKVMKKKSTEPVETLEEEKPKSKLRVKKPRTEAQKQALEKARMKRKEKLEEQKKLKTTEKKETKRKKLVEEYDMDEYINQKVEEKLQKVKSKNNISKQLKDLETNVSDKVVI